MEDRIRFDEERVRLLFEFPTEAKIGIQVARVEREAGLGHGLGLGQVEFFATVKSAAGQKVQPRVGFHI